MHGKTWSTSYKLPCPAEWLKRVNPEVFDILKLNYDEDSNIQEVFMKLMTLSTKLNLKSFDLFLNKPNEKNLVLFTDFLKTQKKLKQLTVGFKSGETLPLDTLDVIIKELPKLSELWFGDFNCLRAEDEARQRILAALPKYNEDPKNLDVNGWNVWSDYCDFFDSSNEGSESDLNEDLDSEISESDLNEDSNEPEPNSAEK